MSHSQPNNSLEISSKTELQYSSSNYLELLCSNTDDINKPNECGWTPLYRTIISGNNNATIELLEKGADPNIQSNLGETALYQAVEMENKKQIDTLLAKGANPNISLEDGTTPLHCAVTKQNKAIIKLLLENGAFPNSKTKVYLQTPLHLAIKTKVNEEIVKTLLEYNASTTMTDKIGKKPIEYAESKEIKHMLTEAESSQLLQISQVSNTDPQNTGTLENKIDSFMSKEDKEKEDLLLSKDPSLKDIITEVNHSDNDEMANGSEKKRTKGEEDYDHLDGNVIQTPNEKKVNHINVNELLSANGNENNNENDNCNEEEFPNEDDNEEHSYLNDSLEDDYNNNNSKPSDQKRSHHISDFPLSSSMKKQSEEEDSMYKKIILAKRLNYNATNKISYHNKKTTNEPASSSRDNCTNIDDNTLQGNNTASLLNITPKNYIDSHHYNSIGNCIGRNNANKSNDNDNDNGHINVLLNKTSDNEMNIKRINNTNSNTNCYSSFSTQPHSANTNSLKVKKKYLDDNQMLYQYPDDNEQYGKVSEFTIKNVTTRQISSLQLSKMKKWLNSIDLLEHLNCFIDNEMCDIDRLKQVMLNYDTKLKYCDFERIGIKKPGHIYRILIKLDIDTHSIDEKIIQFILPSSHHNRTNSIETKLNLKISEEYCCGCSNFITQKNKIDLAMFLRKKTLQHLHPNFAHNGFNWLEFVLLQMFTDYSFKEEIFEDSMHIYNADDRTRLMKCLVDEMKKINLFVNSKEYMANPYKYKYGSIDLEKEEQEKPCQTCLIY